MGERLSSPSFHRFGGVQGSNGATAVSDPLLALHEVEQTVWRELHSLPGVHFTSLTVRRTRDGVCLQGVMETDGDANHCDVAELVRRVAEVENVVNLLLVREPACPSRIPR